MDTCTVKLRRVDPLRKKIIGTSLLVLTLFTGCTLQCRLPSDVVFVIDTTYNLNSDYFTNLRLSLQRVVDRLDVDSGRTRVGAVSVGGTAVAEFDLYTYRTAADVNLALGKISYRGVQPNITDAMRLLRTRMFAKGYGARSQGRDGVVRLAVFFLSNSPGVGLEDLEAQSRLLREIGVEAAAVGVGNYISDAELRALSSYPPENNSFPLPTASNMTNMETTITRIICGDNSNCQDAACWTSPEGRTGCVELFNRAQCVCKEGHTGANCTQQCSGGADVVFVVQTSRDQSQASVQAMMAFVRDVTNSLDVDSSSGGDTVTRVGLVTYEGDPTVRLQLGWFVQDKGEILRTMNVTNLNYSHASAENSRNNLAGAIRTAREVMFKEWNGDRANMQNVLVVVFNGKSDDPVACLAEAEAARQAGIDIIAIGVGGDMDKDEMEGLAGPTVNETGLLLAPTVDSLGNKDWIESVSSAICSRRPIPFAFSQAEKYGLGFGLGFGGGILLIALIIILCCCIRSKKSEEKRRKTEISSGNTAGAKVEIRRVEDGQTPVTDDRSDTGPATVVPIPVQNRFSYEHLVSESRSPPPDHNYTTPPSLPNSPPNSGSMGVRSPPFTSPSSPDFAFYPSAQYLAGSDAITLELDALSGGSTPVRSHPLASRTASPSTPSSGRAGASSPFRGHPLAARTLSPVTPTSGRLPMSPLAGPLSPISATTSSGLEQATNVEQGHYDYAEDVDYIREHSSNTNRESYAYAYDEDSFPVGKVPDSSNGYLLPVDTIPRPLPPIPDDEEATGPPARDLPPQPASLLPDNASMSYDYVLDHSEYSLPVKTTPLPIPNGAKFSRQHSLASPSHRDHFNTFQADGATSKGSVGLSKGDHKSTLPTQGFNDTQHRKLDYTASDTGMGKFRGKDRQVGTAEVNRSELLRALHMRGNKDRDSPEIGREAKQDFSNISSENNREKLAGSSFSNANNRNNVNTIKNNVNDNKRVLSKVNSSNVINARPAVSPKTLRHAASDLGNYPHFSKSQNSTSTLKTLQDGDSPHSKQAVQNSQGAGSKPGGSPAPTGVDFMKELRERQAQYVDSLDYQPGEMYPDMAAEKL